MKRTFLFAFILLLIVPSSNHALDVSVLGGTAGGGGGPTYLVNQNAEGTGYDNSETWTESNNPDEDYTTVALRGSQSIACEADYSSSYIAFTPISGTAYFFFRFQASDLPATNASFFHIRDTDGNVLGSLRLYSDGDVRAYHGTANATVQSEVAADTTYYIWGEYTSGSGSDGTLDVYIGTSTTKPTVDIQITTGTSTVDMGRAMVERDSADTGHTYIFDQILVDDETIGNVDA